MSNPSPLRALAQYEPWRQGRGMPRNALDPTWAPSPLDQPCDGEIAWEGTTNYWICEKCGYVGSAPQTWHKPVMDPVVFFLASLMFHVRKRRENPIPGNPQIAARHVLHRMLYIAGVALRYSATQHPMALGEYAERLVTQ